MHDDKPKPSKQSCTHSNIEAQWLRKFRMPNEPDQPDNRRSVLLYFVRAKIQYHTTKFLTGPMSCILEGKHLRRQIRWR